VTESVTVSMTELKIARNRMASYKVVTDSDLDGQQNGNVDHSLPPT